MPFNVDKCKIIHYGKNNNQTDYIMNNVMVPKGDTMKDLGITFQSNLKFDNHISSITSSANSRLGIIKYTFHNIDREGFLVLYKSMVRPLLEYGTPVWYPNLKKHEREIETIQRRATKMINGIGNLSYSDRLRALNLPTLLYRRRRCDLIQVFKILKNIDHFNIGSIFIYDAGITRKSNQYKLFKPRATKNMKLNCFSHRIINDWNELTNLETGAENVNAFKAALQKRWENKSFKFNFLFT